jgi:hypothetical protein
MSEDETVHLAAPMTPKNYGANVYCPVEKEFTRFLVRTSTDGMEVEVCHACNEPEPAWREVSDADLDALAAQLFNNE